MAIVARFHALLTTLGQYQFVMSCYSFLRRDIRERSKIPLTPHYSTLIRCLQRGTWLFLIIVYYGITFWLLYGSQSLQSTTYRVQEAVAWPRWRRPLPLSYANTTNIRADDAFISYLSFYLLMLAYGLPRPFISVAVAAASHTRKSPCSKRRSFAADIGGALS